MNELIGHNVHVEFLNMRDYENYANGVLLSVTPVAIQLRDIESTWYPMIRIARITHANYCEIEYEQSRRTKLVRRYDRHL